MTSIDSELIAALREIRDACDKALERVTELRIADETPYTDTVFKSRPSVSYGGEPYKSHRSEQYEGAFKPGANLSPVAVMGWGAWTPNIITEDFPLNALGRNEPDDEWIPVHMDQKHIQRDRRGVQIYPFKNVRLMSPAELAMWLAQNHVVAL